MSGICWAGSFRCAPDNVAGRSERRFCVRGYKYGRAAGRYGTGNVAAEVVYKVGFVVVVGCVLRCGCAVLAAALLPFGVLVIYPCKNDINLERGEVDFLFQSGQIQAVFNDGVFVFFRNTLLDIVDGIFFVEIVAEEDAGFVEEFFQSFHFR